jgi:hypothetical protein
MEYNELIINEIYTHKNGNIVKYKNLTADNKVCGVYIGGNKNGLYYNSGNFKIKGLKLATPEEKHWLNTCIQLDKFITFEEAMKTFVPEYVECIGTCTDRFTENKIYKVEEKYSTRTFILLDNLNVKTSVPLIGGLWQFKPSTKEAYDAQFIVKEPEFVLPEKWYIKTTEETFDIIRNWAIEKSNFPNYKEYVHHLQVSFNYNGKYRERVNCTEITFEQFKKYVLKEEIVEEKVIEPLPQFKVIETIETITKVENNEGNQFFIGDVVKSDTNVIHNIKGFKYDINKIAILALTDKVPTIGVSINKIEHYIHTSGEPGMIFIPEETLLEKAKRLYPVGTKVKTATGNDFEIIIKDQSKFKLDLQNNISTTENYMVYLYASYGNKWAEIIND